VDDGRLSLLASHPEIPRRLLTVDEYHRMGEAGILAEDDRVELIEGQLIDMAPISSDHADCVNALTRALILGIGEGGIVSPQNPVRLGAHNEPRPDFAILRPKQQGYRSALPGPEDVLLIVEVAASSLAYDRSVKLPLYARHRIPEVWIVDLAAQEIEIFRTPQRDRYTSSRRVSRSESLDIEALPGVCITANSFLG
jgi:Uma2 family endonuclease